MPDLLSPPAVEKSTYAIDVAFTDDAGVSVVPNAGLTWSLLTLAGSAVNSRTNVAITSAATVTIVLSGNDLALTAGELRKRAILVQGTYNSTLGSNLPLKRMAIFSIEELIGVT